MGRDHEFAARKLRIGKRLQSPTDLMRFPWLKIFAEQISSKALSDYILSQQWQKQRLDKYKFVLVTVLFTFVGIGERGAKTVANVILSVAAVLAVVSSSFRYVLLCSLSI